MNSEEFPVVMMLIYKIITLFCGTLIIYMGYKLFVKGVFSDAGELDGKFGQYHVLMKRAAPGTFFALFGVLVILASVIIGSSDDYTGKNKMIVGPQSNLVPQQPIPPPPI